MLKVASEELVRGGEAWMAFRSVAFSFMYWLYTIAGDDKKVSPRAVKLAKVRP